MLYCIFGVEKFVFFIVFFFFSSRRRHTRCSRDWSSDVCSSDLPFPQIVDWILRHKITPQTYTPGLYVGTSGIALSLLEMGAVKEAEELFQQTFRSEERRVGKECRSRWSTWEWKEKKKKKEESEK